MFSTGSETKCIPIEDAMNAWFSNNPNIKILGVTESSTGEKRNFTFFHNTTIYYESAN
ncbi:MAG: hypothetical protein Q7R84_00325 [bacterium]|nr:hypothetical protein [bacterium]